MASEFQTTYSSIAAETVEYTRDQTFNRQSITEERLGTSVTLAPEASNDRLVLEYLISSNYNSTNEPPIYKLFFFIFSRTFVQTSTGEKGMLRYAELDWVSYYY